MDENAPVNTGTSATSRQTGERHFGPFGLNVASRLLLKDGKPVAIGGRALDILIALTDRAGEVVNRRDLIGAVWQGVFVEETNLRVHIAGLRKTLDDGKNGARYVVNIPGRGYSFVAPLRLVDTTIPASAPGPDRTARAPSLPILRQSLIGRAEAISALSSLLQSRRFISIVGPGGIGKTSVAIAIAQEVQDTFGNHSVFFVDLGSISDPAVVPTTIASALGCLLHGVDAEANIVAFLANRRVLLVLDNCEHVVDAVAQVSERLFSSAPLVHLMTTSREALRVQGESIHLLRPLEGPADHQPTAAAALSSPAVQLFMERAAASGYQAALSESDAPVVADICRRLDGIALAIEIAASRVGTYGIRGTADLIEKGAGVRFTGRRSALPRHQTLRATLDWSVKLLPQHQQEILFRLSAFMGQFSLEAAEAVAGGDDAPSPTVISTIADLVDKSLVWATAERGWAQYRLPETMRTYAAERLAETGDANAIARRHALYFADFLKAEALEGSIFEVDDFAPYAEHMGNVRHALAWCFSNPGDQTLGIELAASAAPIFLGLSLLSECRHWTQKALGALGDMHRGTQCELELQEALAISSMYTRGNSSEVRAAIERGLELCESLQDDRHQLHLLAGLDIFLTRVGDFSGAVTSAKRSATLAARTGGATEGAISEWMIGTAHHLAGYQADAVRHCQRGFDIAEGGEVQNARFFGYDHRVRALCALARALWLSGFADRACVVARQAIEEGAQSDHPVSNCIALLYSVPVLLWSGHLDGTAMHIDTAIAQAQKYSLAPYEAAAQALKGEFLVAHGDASSGIGMLQEALKAMYAEQHLILTASTSRALAEGLARSGRAEEALGIINEVVARAEASSESFWMPDLLRTQGEIHLAQARPDLAAAETTLQHAMSRAREQSSLSWELKAAMPLARLCAEQDRHAEASAILDSVVPRFSEGLETQDLMAARRIREAIRSRSA